MDDSEDIQMADAALSRSSSLSPAPSSLPDTFEDLNSPNPSAHADPDNPWVDTGSKTDENEISLASITLSTPPRGSPMAQTRAQAKAAAEGNSPSMNGAASSKTGSSKKASPQDKVKKTKAAGKAKPAVKSSRQPKESVSDDEPTPAKKPARKSDDKPTPSTRPVSVSDEKPTSPKKPSKKAERKVISKKAAPSRKKKWTAEELLSDYKSPLVKADIRSILCNPEAWDILDDQEKAEILVLLGPSVGVLNSGTPDYRPNMKQLANDSNFQHDCAEYAKNQRDGKHDPQWIREAFDAYDQRAAGEFDAYLKDKFVRDWGVEPPESGDDEPNGLDGEAGEKANSE